MEVRGRMREESWSRDWEERKESWVVLGEITIGDQWREMGELGLGKEERREKGTRRMGRRRRTVSLELYRDRELGGLGDRRRLGGELARLGLR